MKKCLLVCLLALTVSCSSGDHYDVDAVMEKRPSGNRMVFDYVGLLEDIKSSTNDHLRSIFGQGQ